MPKRKRRRANLPLRLILLAIATCILIYVVIVPLFQFYLIEQSAIASGRGIHFLGLFDKISLRGIEVFFACWFFFVGSAIGSFGNVVVYRMPRRISVAAKDSACPFCRQRIKLRHNIPVFGWLILRGRCHVCRLPISSRYPVVELFFGLAFLAMYFATFLLNGNNIPSSAVRSPLRIVELIMDPNWHLVGLYLFHCFLVSTIFIWALIRLDRMPLPLATIVVPVAIGLIVPVFFPFLHPVDFGMTAQVIDNQAVGSQVADAQGGHQIMSWFGVNPLIISVIGMITGSLTGLFTSLIGRADQQQVPLMLGFASVGLFLGWQAVFSCWLVFSLIWLLMRITSVFNQFIERLHILFALVIATILHICFWKPLGDLPIVPCLNTNVIEIVCCLAIGTMLILGARALNTTKAPIPIR